MRVGELSRRTGVSLPSIKYYLRENLLPPGERTGPNQADYGEHHVRRLRLIRALIDVGGLSVAGTRDVLGAVGAADADEVDLHDVLGTTQTAITPAVEPVDDAAAEQAGKVIAELVARRGWRVDAKNPGWRAAIDVLATWDRLGSGTRPEALDAYADAVEALARVEVDDAVDAGGTEQVVENAVLGIVLGGSLLSALRAMAQEDASSRRLRRD